MAPNWGRPIGIIENTPVTANNKRTTSFLQMQGTEFCQYHCKLRREPRAARRSSKGYIMIIVL